MGRVWVGIVVVAQGGNGDRKKLRAMRWVQWKSERVIGRGSSKTKVGM